MSRAKNILEWVKMIDEEAAFDEDPRPEHKLTAARGYTFQDRGQKDVQGDTAVADGTKPSGMQVAGN